MQKKSMIHVFFKIIALQSTLCIAVPCPSKSTIDFPYNGSYLNTQNPTITGTLHDAQSLPVAGEIVRILINDAQVGSAVSDEHGIYRLSLEQALIDGLYVVSVVCVNSGVTLASNAFTIDTTAPVIAIDAPQENQILENATVIISGTTEENAMVTTFVDSDMVGSICYADEYGNWAIEYELSSGAHVVTAQATDIAGNQGYMSDIRNFVVNI